MKTIYLNSAEMNVMRFMIDPQHHGMVSQKAINSLISKGVIECKGLGNQLQFTYVGRKWDKFSNQLEVNPIEQLIDLPPRKFFIAYSGLVELIKQPKNFSCCS